MIAMEAATPVRLTTVVLGRSRGSRGIPERVTVRATALSDLEMEVRAAGQEMVAAGQRIQYARRAGRADLIDHTAAQLVSRGTRYAR